MPHEPRLRDYLTRDEVAALLRSSKKVRHGARNHAMILLAYRHGLRASELVNLRASDLDLRDRRPQADYVFLSERANRMSRSAFWRIVVQAGECAGLAVHAYAHLLRHSCGYYLANKGCDLRLIQDYVGHKQIQNTVRYTTLNPARFAGLW